VTSSSVCISAMSSSQDPMEYLAQAKQNMAAMQAAAQMQAGQAEMAYALRARMEELDRLAGTTSSPAGKVQSSLSAEDRYRFGLDSTMNSSAGRSAKAQPAPREVRREQPREEPRAQQQQRSAPRGASLGGMDPATADLIKKLEACGEIENAKKLRASFGR